MTAMSLMTVVSKDHTTIRRYYGTLPLQAPMCYTCICILYEIDEIWHVRRQKIDLFFSVWQKQLGNFVTNSLISIYAFD